MAQHAPGFVRASGSRQALQGHWQAWQASPGFDNRMNVCGKLRS